MKKRLALILCLALILTFPGCDPASFSFKSYGLEEKVVRVELVNYENPNQKSFVSWVPNHSKQLKPVDLSKITVVQELPAEQNQTFIKQLTEARILYKYYDTDSPKDLCIRLTFDNGEFLLICDEKGSGGYIGSYSQEGKVLDFFGTFEDRRGKQLFINYFGIDPEGETKAMISSE